MEQTYGFERGVGFGERVLGLILLSLMWLGCGGVAESSGYHPAEWAGVGPKERARE